MRGDQTLLVRSSPPAHSLLHERLMPPRYEPVETWGLVPWAGLVVVALVAWRHRGNIQRTIAGTENEV